MIRFWLNQACVGNPKSLAVSGGSIHRGFNFGVDTPRMSN
jgi:hypothetical protein